MRGGRFSEPIDIGEAGLRFRGLFRVGGPRMADAVSQTVHAMIQVL